MAVEPDLVDVRRAEALLRRRGALRRGLLAAEEERHLRLHPGRGQKRRVVAGARDERPRRQPLVPVLLEEREVALAQLGGRLHACDCAHLLRGIARTSSSSSPSGHHTLRHGSMPRRVMTGDRCRVRRVDDADDAVAAERRERVVERRAAALGGVAAAPHGRVERPADLDVLRPEAVVRQADAPDQAPGRALLDRPDAVAVLLPVRPPARERGRRLLRRERRAGRAQVAREHAGRRSAARRPARRRRATAGATGARSSAASDAVGRALRLVVVLVDLLADLLESATDQA